VIVWILVLVLSKVYFAPMRRIMGRRDDQIQQDQGAAQETLEKYAETLQRIEKDIDAAKISARETREEWVREAQREKEIMIEEVSQECRQQVRKAHRELDDSVEHIKKELEPRSQELAEIITKRLLN
jgi:F0F1-type ATP synthase membrane subunit b/b'